MRSRPLHVLPSFGKINVTPMIDVVMVMIVFFLIVGKLAADQRSNIRLPESRHGAKDQSPMRVVISVLASGIVIEGRPTDIDTLPATLSSLLAERPGAVVEIRASRDLSFEPVARVIRACRAAGVLSVRLATEPASDALRGVP